MNLSLLGYIDLPKHGGPGGFDHAAVHAKSRSLFVAHTANNSLDVINLENEIYTHSIVDLKGIAGVLCSDERDLVFTSNRAEDTVGIFAIGGESGLKKIKVGVRPNGLAFAPERNILLVANVGHPDQPETFSLSMIDVLKGEVIRSIPVAGRSRWAIFDAKTDAFYVNIGNPAQIIVVPSIPTLVLRTLSIPGDGPHGLDHDFETGRLFCACDGRQLIALKASTGQILHQAQLSGTPDVIFFNSKLKHLYVAIGDPGVIDVFSTDSMELISTTKTEKGAHTIAFDPEANKVYAFLPESNRAAIYQDQIR